MFAAGAGYRSIDRDLLFLKAEVLRDFFLSFPADVLLGLATDLHLFCTSFWILGFSQDPNMIGVPYSDLLEEMLITSFSPVS